VKETNGRLRVPGSSHRLGVLTAQDIARLRQDLSETCCDMNRGDALLMRPLLGGFFTLNTQVFHYQPGCSGISISNAVSQSRNLRPEPHNRR
jgi:hypothetical protein